MFLPGEMNILPMSIMFSKASLMRRYITLILPYVAWQLPLSTYICYNYIMILPIDLIEAASIDGRRSSRSSTGSSCRCPRRLSPA